MSPAASSSPSSPSVSSALPLAAVAADDRPEGLLAWQLAHYAAGHRTRRNLAVHAITAPLFWAGTLALPATLVLGPFALVPAAIALGGALALQGRGHAGEATAPQPFRGPGDAALRLVAEQWVTFPRFVVRGDFARAWRAARSS